MCPTWTMRSVASAPRGETQGLLQRSGASISTTSSRSRGARSVPGHYALCWCHLWAPRPNSRFLYPRTKGECEAAISTIGFTTVVIVRPSFLVGARARNDLGKR